MEPKAGYYIEYHSNGYGMDTDCALGPFVSKAVALRVAQSVQGYWYCILIATDGYKVQVSNIDSGYNAIRKGA